MRVVNNSVFTFTNTSLRIIRSLVLALPILLFNEYLFKGQKFSYLPKKMVDIYYYFVCFFDMIYCFCVLYCVLGAMPAGVIRG